MPYFDDQGNELHPELMPRPALCLTCVFNNDAEEEILCNLHRLAMRNESRFDCENYTSSHDYVC